MASSMPQMGFRFVLSVSNSVPKPCLTPRGHCRPTPGSRLRHMVHFWPAAGDMVPPTRDFALPAVCSGPGPAAARSFPPRGWDQKLKRTVPLRKPKWQMPLPDNNIIRRAYSLDRYNDLHLRWPGTGPELGALHAFKVEARCGTKPRQLEIIGMRHHRSVVLMVAVHAMWTPRFAFPCVHMRNECVSLSGPRHSLLPLPKARGIGPGSLRN